VKSTLLKLTVDVFTMQAMMERLNENKNPLQQITEYLSLQTTDAERKKEQLYQACVLRFMVQFKMRSRVVWPNV
jgi:hypothetical protein